MKHAAVLYTCIGLMGTAAVVGFVDYNKASKSGLLNGLYSEEKASSVTTLIEKKIDIDDYSRGPIEEIAQEPLTQTKPYLQSKPVTAKKPKKLVTPPKVVLPVVPAPPKLAENETTLPIAEAPDRMKDVPPVPVVEMEAPPAEPPVPEVREVNFKSFSRAPLSTKKITAKRKRVQ